jgi:hypothetical protein
MDHIMTEDIIEVPTYEGGDMCLKFDSEEAATAALEGYPGSIDIIGTIYKPTGNMLPTDQGEVPEMAPMDGFHVNVRHTRPAPELAAHQVFPLNPNRVWA